MLSPRLDIGHTFIPINNIPWLASSYLSWSTSYSLAKQYSHHTLKINKKKQTLFQTSIFKHMDILSVWVWIMLLAFFLLLKFMVGRVFCRS
jgi:hypothetical protein